MESSGRLRRVRAKQDLLEEVRQAFFVEFVDQCRAVAVAGRWRPHDMPFFVNGVYPEPFAHTGA